ncbi:hypothetical protein BCV69DRAFT_167895 [Microstroma glucosiphilum]|uniref:Uncharacterized protein n=1 Tax=Pseudomicrostroma glucosiphilum TaxID=1684307 RepID=A0A316UAB4_9BASI|nr:hypothetical protein BCV69DRAFT_167895 [Pseudomicrostroma glucosiphilum]PWN21353.1 hypothetical protein BCV69DRAFT_167895 [Pseudomicrostroma glucosiphilum]
MAEEERTERKQCLIDQTRGHRTTSYYIDEWPGGSKGLKANSSKRPAARLLNALWV